MQVVDAAAGAIPAVVETNDGIPYSLMRVMHFLVTVFGEDVDRQLAPYQENNFGTCPETYLEFYDVEEEFREEFRSGRFGTTGLGWFHPIRLLKLVRSTFMAFDSDMAEAHSGLRDERTGRYGDWWNPNAEYDFYEVGGRWAGHLILRSGRIGRIETRGAGTPLVRPGRADQARKGDIDFQAMGWECHNRFLDAWDELERTGRTSDRWAKWNRRIPESITTREQLAAYALKRSRVSAPDAVVFEGEWTGPWWDKDDLTEDAADRWDTWYAALLASLPDETLVTVVDCHT